MLRALWYRDDDEFELRRHPGSFMLHDREIAGMSELDYFCPCGCGLRNRLLVGEGFKPGGARPSWRWNGSRSDPTLTPSVQVAGHWHGWLEDGYWRTA